MFDFVHGTRCNESGDRSGIGRKERGQGTKEIVKQDFKATVDTKF